MHRNFMYVVSSKCVTAGKWLNKLQFIDTLKNISLLGIKIFVWLLLPRKFLPCNIHWENKQHVICYYSCQEYSMDCSFVYMWRLYIQRFCFSLMGESHFILSSYSCFDGYSVYFQMAHYNIAYTIILV